MSDDPAYVVPDELGSVRTFQTKWDRIFAWPRTESRRRPVLQREVNGLPSRKRENRINRLIRRNDGYFECHYCHEPLTMFTVTLDHVVPLVKGGSDNDDNLVLACKPCNNRKSDKDVDEFIASRAG